MPGASELTTADRLLTGAPANRNHCDHSQALMGQVTTRWGALIIAALIHGPHRFHELRSRVEGISAKMLSYHLKTLVRAGLAHREVEPTVPPQVTYSLTALGAGLATPLTDLIHWFGQHAPEIVQAQAQHDGTA